MITLCPECQLPAVQLSAEVRAELSEHGLILIHKDCYFQEQLPFPSKGSQKEYSTSFGKFGPGWPDSLTLDGSDRDE